MIIFVPAWYRANQWDENEQNWYDRKMHTEFDDTVKQIQLFHRNSSYDYEICLLSFAPNFRHFLHRQGVYNAPYFSVFDAINECGGKRATVFSYKDLDWLPHTEFIYTPFVVTAEIYGRKYAQIDFGEDGNLIQIAMYEGEDVAIRNIYDDRGFVSSAIMYSAGTAVYQDYYNENGTWKIRQFFDDGHIEINPERNFYVLESETGREEIAFTRDQYESLEEVIYEIFQAYVARRSKEDIFCIAMHTRHSNVVRRCLSNHKKILSFFKKRFDMTGFQEYQDLIRSADYIVADANSNIRFIEAHMPDKLQHITNISPYDTRKEMGISQQLNVQKILVAVDDISPTLFEKLVVIFANYFEKNPKARVHFFTRVANYDRCDKIINRTKEILEANDFDGGLAVASSDTRGDENKIDAMDEVTVKFFAEQCVDELAASRTIREQRIIVNLSDDVDLYLQISGVSFGIPQLVREETQYVKNRYNGLVIREISDVEKGLDYYLSGLNNWNQALINAFELGENYTTDKLLEQWREVIEHIG